MDQTARWERNYKALEAYVSEHGHALVPAGYVDDGVQLGNWVNYMRVRYRQGKLSDERAALLGLLAEWDWGPLTPGPRRNASFIDRNKKIVEMREQGYSLAKIAEAWNMTRQRVHQIVSDHG
jgi:hypothetical protein